LRAAGHPRNLPGVTIRWFTDADRQDMRDAEEARRVLAELVEKYRPMYIITAEERAERIAHPRRDMGFLKINPYRRS
jgi:hypothetical protein